MNNRINNIKFIAAIGVVIIHLNGYFTHTLDIKAFDTFFMYIGRFAVPYFLIISGYFWMGKNKKESIKSMLLLQLVLVTLIAIEEAMVGGVLKDYIQLSNPRWYLPAVSLMMMVALFIKEKDYIYLWIMMFIVANIMLIFGLRIKIVMFHFDIVSNFLKYAYMFYFGYILKQLMKKENFIRFISKYSHQLLGITIIFQVFNATNNTYNFDQYTTVQFLFTIPLVLFAISPNNDKAFKYNKYSLDLFLYHILIVSIFAYLNTVYLVNATTTMLVTIYILELLITIPTTILFDKFLRFIDKKYLNLIY